MKAFGKLISVQGNKISLELENGLNISKVTKLAANKKPIVEINIDDGRSISPDQRKKIYAIIGDISNWSGYSIEKEAPEVMKWSYLTATGVETFSLSTCSMTTANKYLSWLLDFCFDNDVPFKTRTWDMLPNDYAMQYRCLTHRKCCICGRYADIAHYQTVGMGRSRQRIDHSKFYFMSLCRTHHTEQHKIGITTFLQKYHIKPIKLDEADRKKLHIGG